MPIKDRFISSQAKIFKAERLKQKELGNKSKQYALKILINGGYGIYLEYILLTASLRWTDPVSMLYSSKQMIKPEYQQVLSMKMEHLFKIMYRKWNI